MHLNIHNIQEFPALQRSCIHIFNHTLQQNHVTVNVYELDSQKYNQQLKLTLGQDLIIFIRSIETSKCRRIEVIRDTSNRIIVNHQNKIYKPQYLRIRKHLKLILKLIIKLLIDILNIILLYLYYYQLKVLQILVKTSTLILFLLVNLV